MGHTAWFNKLFLGTGCLLFIIAAIRAYLIPLSHDEAATFFLYVQNNNYMPFYAFIYTNNHVLNSALTQCVYSLLGSHPFVLRLPSLLSLVVLIYGVWRIGKHLTNERSQFLLLLCLLLMPGAFDFFSLSRGYSYSMAFFTLGIGFFLDWRRLRLNRQLMLFMLCLQLAMAANLIFVTVAAVFLSIVVLLQIRQRDFFRLQNMVVHAVNAAFFSYWVAVSFLYRTAGVLDYGVGENYWKVTFKSLIWLLTGSESMLVQGVFIAITCMVVLHSLYWLFRHGWRSALNEPTVVLCGCFALLILAFKLQKLVLEVNYPEDRTGLFFFTLLSVLFVFVLDKLPQRAMQALTFTTALTLAVLFVMRVSFFDFTNYLYHTLPNHLYEQLIAEQKGEPLYTVGGHRVREMDYAFLNYRHGAALNPMDEREEMQMNCDYYIANLDEAPCYDPFYSGIDTDYVWNRVLLKRKSKLERELIVDNQATTQINNAAEFNEFWIQRDTAMGTLPFEAHVQLTFDSVPVPFKGSLVFSAEDSSGTVFYRRILLNWLGDQLSGKTKTLILTGANLPAYTTKAVVYLWNTNKLPIKCTIHNIKIYRLHGKGVDYTIPAAYYTQLEAITKRPRL